jgi:excisionase family DNA binding protein
MSEQKLSYSFDEFARLQGISKATLYGLIARGEGPKTYRIGSLRRISAEAGNAWIRLREKQATPVQPVARLERGKRKKQATQVQPEAGKASAKSSDAANEVH